jgi:hypothetical protein
VRQCDYNPQQTSVRILRQVLIEVTAELLREGNFTTKNLEYLTDIVIPSLCTYVRTDTYMHECICVDSLDQVGAP